MKNKILPYLVGALLNMISFFIGSNLLIQIVVKLFVPDTEYKAYLLWCILGLCSSFIGNIIGILIIDSKKILQTIMGATIGLCLGAALSFVPYCYIGGIITIFIGSIIGHEA